MKETELGKIIEVITRLKSGDQYAFEELYTITHNRVYFLALKLVRNHNDAIEVVQETFISVYQYISKLSKLEAFNAWLSKIIINKCKDCLGRQKEVLMAENEESDDRDANEVMEDITTDFIPHEVLDKAETRNMMMALIDKLPDAQRTTVMLHYYQGLHIEEIAAIMECPAATVKSRLNYARRQIKVGVEGYEAKGVKLYNIAISPVIVYLLEEFSKESVLGPTTAAQILSSVGAAVLPAAAASVQASVAGSKLGLLHKFAALSVRAKIASWVIAGAVLVTSAVTPLAIMAIHKGSQSNAIAPSTLSPGSLSPSSLPPASTLSVTIQKTYRAAYQDDEYGVWGSAEYNRPVFSGSSPVVQKLNAFYDSLETQWKMDNGALTKTSWDFFKSDLEGGISLEDLINDPYYNNVTCQIPYHKNGILSIVMDQDTFITGAVHGESQKTSHTFETNSGQELLLTDLLKVDQAAAADIVINAFTALRDSDSSYDSIEMSVIQQNAGNNTKFYLDEEGIWLYFNEYEVDSYAAGLIKTCIPYSSANMVSPGPQASETSANGAPSTTQEPVAQSVGNTAANIMNGGVAVLRDGWIYYANDDDNDYLYRIRTDGTEKTKLSGIVSDSINVVGDWIYYTQKTDRALYKVHTDGTAETSISGDYFFRINVSGDWIYYLGVTGNHQTVYSIYKIRTDGTQKSMINTDKAYAINVVGDWIYYTNISDNNAIYKMHTDGTEKTKLNNHNSQSINVIGDWIYYTNESNNHSFYKIKTDGTGETGLGMTVGYTFNVVGDWVYYAKESDGWSLYKCRTDGTDETKLIHVNMDSINVAGDWIYYNNVDEGDVLYRIRTDGTEKQLVD